MVWFLFFCVFLLKEGYDIYILFEDDVYLKWIKKFIVDNE